MTTSALHDQRQPADPGQIGAVTLLLGLLYLPLLSRMQMQVMALVAVLFALRLVALRWPSLRPGRWLLAALTLVALITVLDAYRGVAGQQPGTALLLAMVALKLLEAQNRRDLRVLTQAICFILVIAFLFERSAAFTAWLALLLVGNLALMVDLSRTVPPVPAGGAGQLDLGQWARWRPALRTALKLAGQALPLALVLFVLFPRLDRPLWDLGITSERAVTGFKDWLEPGTVGELVISGEDAFHARFATPPPMSVDNMYWRGPVLWRTDGRRWLPLPDYRRDQGWPDAPPPRVLPQGPTLEYTVVMEPTDQHWLLALDLPVEVPEDARITPDFQVLTARPVTNLRMYEITSAPAYRTAGLAPEEAQAALQLPEHLTPRMRALVASWTADGAAPRQVVERVLSHFREQPFRYTLVPPVLGENPTDEFLFETQAGFCEHYAASFALLMRMAGIPARIVAGFLGAEYNPVSGLYLVRQSDAHAWTEVWLEDAGWVRVDPTAAVDPARVERDPRLSGLGAGAPVRFRIDDQGRIARAVHGLRYLVDALDSGWKDWVLGYSAAKQRVLLSGLGLEHLRQYGLAILLLAASTILMLLLNLLLARRPPSRDPVVRAFERACGRLGRIGLGRTPGEGPLDYRARIARARPDLVADLDAVLEPYLALHYAADPADPAGTDPTRLAELRRAVAALRPRRQAGPARTPRVPGEPR